MIVRILLISFRYLVYLFRAKNRHGIHSPFVYDFINKVLNDKTAYPEYKLVEEKRRALLRNGNLVEIIDFGGSKSRIGYSTHLRRVKDIAAKAGIPVKYGRLLYRIVRYFKPSTMLEMGTSLGISTMYQATAAPAGKFLAMEGCASTVEFAVNNLNAINIPDVHFTVGNFDKVLPGLLKNTGVIDYAFIDGNHTKKATLNYFGQLIQHTGNDSVYIFHDIHWSAEMEQAWEEIKKHENVTVTIDLFFMGLVFFRKELSRQHFIIRF
ncbi:MAG: class I SAM-dependent methyltransferase [Lentimicrobium sp.]|nr:class I SAM-dependent methyltransferase [Lentimicrobium sp.]